MAILITIDGSTGLTIDEANLPSQSALALLAAFTAEPVNTSSSYIHGYYDYEYDDNGNTRLASDDGKPLYAHFIPNGQAVGADLAAITAWVNAAPVPDARIFYVATVVSDTVIPLDVNTHRYTHYAPGNNTPVNVAFEWTGTKFIPAQDAFNNYNNFEVPPTFDMVTRPENTPDSGVLSFKVTQDANEPGYDGITWYNEATTYVIQNAYPNYRSFMNIYKKEDNSPYIVLPIFYRSNSYPYSTSDPKFAIIDIRTDPLNPTIVGTVDVTLNDYMLRTGFQQDNYFYTVDDGGDYCLYIVDISTPTAPQLVSATTNSQWYSGVVLGKQGSYIFIGSGVNINAVDISDPTNPTQYGVALSIGVAAHTGTYSEGYLYIYGGSDHEILTVVSVSNPNNMHVVYTEDVHTTYGIYNSARTSALHVGNYIYLMYTFSTSYPCGMLIYDKTDPSNLIMVKNIVLPEFYTFTGGIAYNQDSKIAFVIAIDYAFSFRIDGVNTTYMGKYATSDVTEGTNATGIFVCDGNHLFTIVSPSGGGSPLVHTARFVDLAIKGKPLSIDLANDTESFAELNRVNWLDSWGSDGSISASDCIYTPTTRPIASLAVLGTDGYEYVYYTNVSFPVDTIIIPQSVFTNLGVKNTGAVRVKGYLDLILDDGNGNLSRSSVNHNTFRIDLLPNAEYPGNDILWWMTQSSSSTAIIKGVMFVAEGFEAANPDPLRLLETTASGLIGFKYDPAAIPQDSTSLAPSQITSNIFNNADVALTGYFDAYYFDNGVEKQALVENKALTKDFQARDSYPKSDFTNWLNTFPNVPYSIWYHVGTYQEVAPVTPPVVIKSTTDDSSAFSFQIADVPVSTNHLDPNVIDTDLTNTSDGYFSGYFDYVYDDNGTPRLASDSNLELAHTYTPGSTLSLSDFNNWLSNAPSAPTEVFYHVNDFSATAPSSGGGGLPTAPVFSAVIPMARHYTDGVTPDDIADDAGYGTTQYTPTEYYPTGQTTTSRYYQSRGISNDVVVDGLDANTDYKMVVIADNVVTAPFTTDTNGHAAFRLPDEAIVTSGTITTTIYDANNTPINTCNNPQTWASSVRVVFIREDGWCFYGSINIATGELTSNADISAGTFDKIIIRSQTTGELIPRGTTFKLLKPGHLHAELNPFVFAETTASDTREFDIEIPNGIILPAGTEQKWEELVTTVTPAPCGDGLEGIADTYLDVILNQQADGSSTMGIPGLITVDPLRDTDADGITDIIEGAPTTDTDADGVEDYRDFDSDADGIPDFIEGADDDADNDGIKAFQDPDEGVDQWWELHNMPTDVVTMQNYNFSIEHYAHIRVADGDLHVTITPPKPLNISPIETVIAPGETKDFTMLLSEPDPQACSDPYPENPMTITVTYTYNNAAGEEQSSIETYEINRVKATEEFPYKGNIVKWLKQDNAVSYNIYRKSPEDNSYLLLTNVLHNAACSCEYQFIIDRTGEPGSYYQISAIYADGTESEHSNALRSNSFKLDLCTIQGVVTSIDGRPIADVAIASRLKKAPRVIKSVGMYKYNQHTLTGKDGGFVLKAPQGSVILLTIDDIGFREELLVPLAPAADFQEMLETNNSEALL